MKGIQVEGGLSDAQGAAESAESALESGASLGIRGNPS
jgi:hypothetical protein